MEDRSFLGRARAFPTGAGFAACVALAAALALVLLGSPGRPRWRRLVPAAWLVLLGVAAECLDVVLAGRDVLPDAVALALAALGGLVLARSVGGRARWLSPALFGLGALLVLLEDARPDPLASVRLLVVWAGVAAIPGLAGRLRGPSAAGRPRRAYPTLFHVLYVTPLVAAAVLVAVQLGTGARWTNLRLEGTSAGLLLVLLGACALWALANLVQAAAVRAAWMRSRSGTPPA